MLPISLFLLIVTAGLVVRPWIVTSEFLLLGNQASCSEYVHVLGTDHHRSDLCYTSAILCCTQANSADVRTAIASAAYTAASEMFPLAVEAFGNFMKQAWNS